MTEKENLGKWYSDDENMSDLLVGELFAGQMQEICSRAGFIKWSQIDKLRPTQNWHLFTDSISKCIFIILIQICLKFVPVSLIDSQSLNEPIVM